MANKKLTRLLALIMAVVCTLTVVSAAVLYDENGDDKVTVWDLQALLGKTNYNAAVKKALGGGDELNPVDGVYEIYTELGLRNMVKNADKGYSFKLMANIDLKGADWTPIVFSGNFNGNGYSIKNVTITESVYGRGKYNMGFFGVVEQYTKADVVTQSQVSDLNLENVNVTATATNNATYIGLLAGTNLGIVKNCTATGSVTDDRTELTSDVYVGALLGRNHNAVEASGILAGKLYKGSGSLLTVGTGKEDEAQRVSGVSAVLGTVYAELAEGQTNVRRTGIVGYSNSANLANSETDTTNSFIWQDASNSTAYTSEAEQKNRATVEQEMYKMGSVKWTPSDTITFTRFGDPTLSHSNAFVAGRTYTGIPYVGAKDGNYTRFMSKITTDADGNYVTVDGLTDGTQTKDEQGIYSYDGFVNYMGSNCTWAVVWSWATVSPYRVHNLTGTPTTEEMLDAVYGGVAADDVTELIPTASRTATYGVLPVGGYEVADGTTDTQSIVVGNEKTLAECYAQAHKGDAIVFKGETLSGSSDAHSRLLAEDPVIIRQGKSGTSENTIDLGRSYILYHGQGDGLSDASTDKHGEYTIKYSSWRLYHKVTLTALLTKAGCQAAVDNGEKPGSYWGYIPVTMRAFSWDESVKNTKTPYYTTTGNAEITLPNTGSYYSNYRNVSATMVITKKDTGDVVYNHTSYMETTATTASFNTLDLSVLFKNATKNLTEGTTYLYSLSFTASNGDVSYPKIDGRGGKGAVLKDYEFTYYAS